MRASERGIVGLEEVRLGGLVNGGHGLVSIAGGHCGLIEARIDGWRSGMPKRREGRTRLASVLEVGMRVGVVVIVIVVMGVGMRRQVDAVIRLWACAEVDLHGWSVGSREALSCL